VGLVKGVALSFALYQTTDMSTGAERHILLAQTGQFGQTHPGLHVQQQEGVVALADPRLARRGGQQRLDLRANQEVNEWSSMAFEWGILERSPLRVQMLPGENQRDRVLTSDEESRYFKATIEIGDSVLASYAQALEGIRARRGEIPEEPDDPFLLRDVTTMLLDCALRPEESFRLRWQHVRDGALHIPFGKTENARRRIPLTQRATALLHAAAN
jgi:integrase